MPKTTVAAIDLGATSGRVIVGTYSANDGLALTEVHRFPNGFHELNGHCYWGVGALLKEIRHGLREAKKLFPDLRSCGVDTWGCDYAHLTRTGRLLHPTHAYRDTRTEPILARIKAAGDDRTLYQWTGLPAINYNSGLQLQETLEALPAMKGFCERVLFLSDYLNYLLSGAMVNEFSQASTSMLLDASGTRFSAEALKYFGIPEGWFEGPVFSGRLLGKVRDLPGLEQVEVALVPGHDTSCAFEAIPRRGHSLIVSSGTWLLAGAFTDNALLSEEAYKLGISNERTGRGGYRPCKILLGLWLLEQTLPSFNERPKTDAEWSALISAAEERPTPTVLIDTADPALFNPKEMKLAIDGQLRAHGGTPPKDLPGYVRLICASLAASVSKASETFARLGGKEFDNIVIVGGGSKNRLLCQLMADAARLPVTSYGLEATSVGNIAYQLLALGAVQSLEEFHGVLAPRLTQQVYQPR